MGVNLFTSTKMVQRRSGSKFTLKFLCIFLPEILNYAKKLARDLACASSAYALMIHINTDHFLTRRTVEQRPKLEAEETSVFGVAFPSGVIRRRFQTSQERFVVNINLLF
jgi:hypothetical protein